MRKLSIQKTLIKFVEELHALWNLERFGGVLTMHLLESFTHFPPLISIKS